MRSEEREETSEDVRRRTMDALSDMSADSGSDHSLVHNARSPRHDRDEVLGQVKDRVAAVSARSGRARLARR